MTLLGEIGPTGNFYHKMIVLDLKQLWVVNSLLLNECLQSGRCRFDENIGFACQEMSFVEFLWMRKKFPQINEHIKPLLRINQISFKQINELSDKQINELSEVRSNRQVEVLWLSYES